MLDVPASIKNNYGKLLAKRGIPLHKHNFYQKWLRFYFDYCRKYNHDSTNLSSLTHFIKKLNEKNQTSQKQSQASHAIRLYYELKNIDALKKTVNQNINAIQEHSSALTKDEKLWAKIYTDLDFDK